MQCVHAFIRGPPSGARLHRLGFREFGLTLALGFRACLQGKGLDNRFAIAIHGPKYYTYCGLLLGGGSTPDDSLKIVKVCVLGVPATLP